MRTADQFILGVDSNFAWEMTQGDLRRPIWQYRGEQIELYPFFADCGVDLLRVRVWTCESGPGSVPVATQIALAGQAAGLSPHIVIFGSDSWSDINNMPLPKRWSGTSISERQELIESWTSGAIGDMKDQGVQCSRYAVGNETDFGFCGYYSREINQRYLDLLREGPFPAFGMPDEPRPGAAARLLDELRRDIWPSYAGMLAACARGIRKADPDAKTLLHLALSWEPVFCGAFFETMLSLGVDFDAPAVSCYPSVTGDLGVPVLEATVQHCASIVGSPVLLPECAYPSGEPTGMFEIMRNARSAYPLTPEGQASWLAHQLSWASRNSHVSGFIYWSPEWYTDQPVWGQMALFDETGAAKPAIEALRSFGRSR